MDLFYQQMKIEGKTLEFSYRIADNLKFVEMGNWGIVFHAFSP